MRLPDEYFQPKFVISKLAFRLAMELYMRAESKFEIKVTQVELAKSMYSNIETIRKSTQELEALGLIRLERTKRNLGKFHIYKYILTAEVDSLRRKELKALRDKRARRNEIIYQLSLPYEKFKPMEKPPIPKQVIPGVWNMADRAKYDNWEMSENVRKRASDTEQAKRAELVEELHGSKRASYQ